MKTDTLPESGAKTEFGSLLAISPDQEPRLEAGSVPAPPPPAISTESKEDAPSEVLLLLSNHCSKIHHIIVSHHRIRMSEKIRNLEQKRFLMLNV